MFAQLHLLALLEEPGGDRQIEFLFVKAEFLQGEEWIRSLEEIERIEVRDGMPKRSVGIHESFDPCLKAAIGTTPGASSAVALSPFSSLLAKPSSKPSKKADQSGSTDRGLESQRS